MKERSYGVCLYKIEKNKIFVLLNKTNSFSDYNFFKGKIEKGESITDTVLREIKEETFLDLDKKDLEDYFLQENKRKDIGIFLVNWKNVKEKRIRIQEKEIYAIKWVDISTKIEFSKNQKKIWDFLRKILLKKLI
jgi:8-oxo-dGTP pyrophosphatase MutT (NUDIX family)